MKILMQVELHQLNKKSKITYELHQPHRKSSITIHITPYWGLNWNLTKNTEKYEWWITKPNAYQTKSQNKMADQQTIGSREDATV